LLGRAESPLQLGTQLAGALALARDVVTHMQHPPGPRNRRQQRVERDHAIGVRRGHGESPADVVERPLADPANPGLNRLERGKQQVPPRPRRVSATRSKSVSLLVPLAAVPSRAGRPEESIDGLPFLGSRLGVQEVKVHYAPCRAPARAAAGSADRTGSTRTAQALNSAVPDLGSVSSMVRMLTFTSSWKWNVMKTSPDRSDRSIRAGATTLPRRDVTRTGSPFSTPIRSASSGEMSRLSPRRRGDVYPPVWTPVL